MGDVVGRVEGLEDGGLEGSRDGRSVGAGVGESVRKQTTFSVPSQIARPPFGQT